MEWGYKAARRGYWQEALLRFEHANQLTPDRPRILNNIAVAQEANGLFEQALLTYQMGLVDRSERQCAAAKLREVPGVLRELRRAAGGDQGAADEGVDDAKQDN